MKYTAAFLLFVATAVTATALPPLPVGSIGPLGGVNTVRSDPWLLNGWSLTSLLQAGYDFSVGTDGSFTGTGVSPPVAQYTHFASQGANIFRIRESVVFSIAIT